MLMPENIIIVQMVKHTDVISKRNYKSKGLYDISLTNNLKFNLRE